MRFLHGVAVVIGGGRLKLHVEDIVQRRHVCFIHNFDRVAVAARLQGGGGGIGGQLGGNLLVDLCHGQPQAHGLVLVDADIHLGIAGLLTVRDVLNAVNALHQRGHLLARGAQILQIVAVEVNLHTGAGQRAHIHHTVGVHGDGAVHIGRSGVDFLGNGLGGGAGVQQDIVGKGRVVGGAARARHHHALRAAGHGTDCLNAVNAHHGIHHAVRRGKGVLLGGIVGHVHGDGNLVAAHIGNHNNAHCGHTPDRGRQQHHGQRQRHGLAAQAEAQQLLIAVQNLVKPRVLDVLLLFQHGGARAGHHGQRHNQRRQQAEGDSPRHIAEQFQHHAGGKDQRQEHADGGQRGGDDSARHLPCALHRGAGCRDAPVAQTVDILNDNDRVIDQHTDAQRQTGQGEDVEGDAGKIHQHNGEQHAQRHTDGHHDGRAQVLQEERQHDDGQHSALDKVGEHAVDNQLDVIALVHNGGQVQALVLRHQRLHGRLAGVGDGGGGRRGALVNREQNRTVLVHLGVGIIGVVGHFHIGHIGQPHIANAVDVAQHHIFQLIGIAEGVADLDDIAVIVARTALDIARRHREVLGVNQLLQGGHIQQLAEVCVFQGLLAGGVILLLRGLQLGFAGLQLGAPAG